MSTNQVSLSSAMRSNLLSLQNTSKTISQNREYLSTSKKVSSAMDNPTNYFAALSPNSKSDTSSARLTDTVRISQEAINAHSSVAQNFTLGDEIAADMRASQRSVPLLNDTIYTHSSVAHDLTLADPNEEAANMLALQTQQTLRIQSLAIPNSTPSVLKLF